MHHTKSDIFWKCWIWSAVLGCLAAGFYTIIANIGPHWLSGDIFFDLVIVFGVLGAYFGAGLVGWRIADKYYHAVEKQFIKRYIAYSITTFILLVGITYTPLSIVGLLWSFVAPFCVIKALDVVKKR